MNFDVSTQALVQLITKTERVTSKKSALPILSNIYFEVNKEQLLIRSTNLEIGVEGSIPITNSANIKKSQSFVISASLLKNFLQQIRSSKKTTIVLDGESSAVFKTESAEATITISSAEEYPTLPEIASKNKGSLEISSTDFSDGVMSVWYAAATSTMKPELSSIYIHTHNNELFFVATDTFRLAEKVISSKSYTDNLSLLVPSQNAVELTRLINEDEHLHIDFDENLLEIKQGTLRITARVIDGNFPDYRQIIPAEFETTATMLFYDFENSLRLSSVFADKYHQVTMSFSSNLITVESKGTEAGKSITTIKASIDGEELAARFNQKYLLDPLGSLKGDNIELKLSPNKPMMITNPANNSFRYLVMPMHQ